MRKKFLLAIGIMTALSLAPAAAYAAPASAAALGVDISAPQCGDRIINRFAFVIVGVNGGLATTPNPCLDKQLAWARGVSGATTQEKLQLYVNTANPGGLNTDSWPRTNIDPSEKFVMSEYGFCDGGDTLACAWQYGWNRAYDDVNKWFPPAASSAGVSADPTSYRWWLDVETENTWKLSGSAADHESNVAVLEGMAAYFASRGTRTGIYSTAYQWGEITGGAITPTSNLQGLPNWRPGGRSLETAKQACQAQPLTVGGSVLMTQYIYRGLDYNYSCQ